LVAAAAVFVTPSSMVSPPPPASASRVPVLTTRFPVSITSATEPVALASMVPLLLSVRS
jgi:hypothetical protein